MDLLTLHKIIFFSWLLIGVVYCIFLSKKTGKMRVMETVIFTALGPGGWIHIGLLWLFQYQYRKNPDFVNDLLFMATLILTLVLMYVIFPLIRIPM